MLRIPDDLRAFLRDVAVRLDSGDRAALLGPDAIHHDCARGGRVEGELFRFTYFAQGGHGRWELELDEARIRAIAGGGVDEIEAEELEPGTRTTRGEPLIVWGEYPDDALRVRGELELAFALDALQAISTVGPPSTLRLWSSADDQVFAVIDGDLCALYVVCSSRGYGTSVGDPTRGDSFQAGELAVPWSHCVPWRTARPALLQFATSGELGDHVILDGTIPSQLLVLSDCSRFDELATRAPPPADPAVTSLPR
jgi:hypothetical protein